MVASSEASTIPALRFVCLEVQGGAPLPRARCLPTSGAACTRLAGDFALTAHGMAVRAKLAERLAAVAKRSTLRLTHYGRKTGTAYQVTIWFVVEREDLYLATMNATRQWVRNIAKTPHVRLQVADLEIEGRVARLTAQPDLLHAYELFTGKYWAAWLLDRVASLLGRSPRTAKRMDTGRGAFFRVQL